MLPFHMLAALPVQPSPRLALLSVTSVPSALKSPRSPIAEFLPASQPPNHFPLFPHPVNIAHAQTPATPSPSIVYFTTSVYPGGGTLHSLSRVPLSPHAMSHACSCPVHNSFKRNAYKKSRGPPRHPCTALPRYSLLTTHYSLSSTIRYTIPSRHT